MISNQFSIASTMAMATLFLFGCTNEKPPKQGSSTSVTAPTDIFQDWIKNSPSSISLSESKNGKVQSFLLTGKNQTLEAAIGQVKKHITKPIQYGDKVDSKKVLSEFSIEVADGTWNDLLFRIGDTFGFEVRETDEAFVVEEKLIKKE